LHLRVNRQRVPRTLTLRGALDGRIRIAQWNGSEHVVVPVVALVEGVIWPMNAEMPEFVPADVLQASVPVWNGRACVNDHPIRNGVPVSANDPEVFEEESFGLTFNSYFKNKALRMEAWLSRVRAGKVGPRAEEIITRAEEHDDIEVSVGAFVDLVAEEGEFNGQKYGERWNNILSDHLALLSKGEIGACSVDMGCGAPRLAKRRIHILSAGKDRLTIKEEEPMAKPAEAPEPGKEQKKTSWIAGLRDLMKGGTVDTSKPVQLVAGAATFDMADSNVELESALATELRAKVPGFMGIEAVSMKDNIVLFSAMPRDKWQFFTHEFSTRGGSVKLKGEPAEVEPVTRFEPVAASSTVQPTDASACGCAERKVMDKKALIASLIASPKNGFTAASQAVLESMTDEQLKALQAADEAFTVPAPAPAAQAEQKPAEKKEEPVVAAKKPLDGVTEDEVIAAFPSIGDVVRRQRAAEAKRRQEIVTAMEGKQTAYTKDELMAKPIDELEKLVALMKVETTTDTSLNAPRMARVAPEDEEIPEAPDFITAVRGSNEKKSA